MGSGEGGGEGLCVSIVGAVIEVPPGCLTSRQKQGGGNLGGTSGGREDLLSSYNFISVGSQTIVMRYNGETMMLGLNRMFNYNISASSVFTEVLHVQYCFCIAYCGGPPF